MKKKYIILITALPTLLVLLSGLSLLMYVRKKGPDSAPMESEVTRNGVQGTLEKLYSYIGKREMATDPGRRNLRSVVAMVDGTLGLENMGYLVHRSEGEISDGLIWPMLWIDLGAKKPGKVKVLAIAQDDEGAALALGIHFAEYVAGHWDGGHVKIVFYSPLMAGPDKEKIWKTLGISMEKRDDFYSLVSGAEGEETPRVTIDQVRIDLMENRMGEDQADVIMGLLPKVGKLLQ